jgi:hypothetical protein
MKFIFDIFEIGCYLGVVVDKVGHDIPPAVGGASATAVRERKE